MFNVSVYDGGDIDDKLPRFPSPNCPKRPSI
jgi:hypothetical protein